jgi:signal transduction histidine kinase
MRPSRLNTIATRLAATILLAIILGIGLEAVIGLSVACLASRPGTHVVASRWGVFVFNGHRAPIFMFHLGGSNPEMLAARTAATVRLIASEPATDLPRIVAAATRPDLRLVLADAPTLGAGDDGSGEFGLLRRLIEFELGDPSRPVRVAADRASEDDDDIIEAMENMGSLDDGDAQSLAAPPQSMALRVEAPLPDGRWLLMSVPDYGADKVSLPRVALVVSPLLMLIGLLSVLTARRLAAPIREFVAAAERLGVDPRAPPLAELGPHELRVATRAFNRMQDRLRRFVSDRTQMLAAMSHDLRTPLNRLRLRAELIDDDEQQKKMFADLEAMNAMIDSTLAFARDDVRRDPRRLVDLGVLVGDVCEDAVDAGAAASYAGPRGVNVCCRPSAVSRAVANLVENAVKYGKAARVDLVREAECVIVTVDDDGPGIPPEEQAKVFAPFYRLEPSRNADSGGVGLGLSVARTIAREHGGDVTLVNRVAGGLRACLTLPADPATLSGA